MNNNNYGQWRNIHFWALILLCVHENDGHLTICEIADSFGLTQSALSRQIKAMEATFGYTLLQRNYRGVSNLTREAEQLIPHLQQVIQAMNHIQQIRLHVLQSDASLL